MAETPINEQINPEEDPNEEQDLFEHYRITVDKGQAPLRIDKFLMLRIQNASRNKIQHAASEGCVLVNDKAVKSNYKVKPLDIISVVLPNPPRDKELYPEDLPLDIVYEDDELMVVNKQAGMVVHPGYNNYTGTLVNALVYHFQNLPTSQNGEQRPGLVHRIDKDTSGLLVIAKTEAAMTHLAKQFYDHSIERTYWALVWGEPETDEGTVQNYLARSLKDRRVMATYDEETDGKLAITHYKTLQKFHYVTLVECRLETGRTHQIRVHMQSIGHSLFNDASYGGDRILKGTTFTKYRQFIDNCFKLMPRQALHARSLGFVHPKTKKDMYFECPLPEDFQAVMTKWETYSQTLGDS